MNTSQLDPAQVTILIDWLDKLGFIDKLSNGEAGL